MAKHAFLTLNKTLDLMHGGAVLQLMHTGADRHEWFILHKNGGRVKPQDAEKLLAMPNIAPSNDGLFGASQTYRII
jgi:hypothetical protein